MREPDRPRGDANLKELEASLAIGQDPAHSKPRPPGARWGHRTCFAPGRAIKTMPAHREGETSARGRPAALGAGARQGPAQVGDEGVGERATALGPLASRRRQEAPVSSRSCCGRAVLKGLPGPGLSLAGFGWPLVNFPVTLTRLSVS